MNFYFENHWVTILSILITEVGFFWGVLPLNFVPEASALLASPSSPSRLAVSAENVKVFHQLQTASWGATSPAERQGPEHSCLGKLLSPRVPFQAGDLLDTVVTGWKSPPEGKSCIGHWCLCFTTEIPKGPTLRPRSFPKVTGLQASLTGFLINTL